MAGMAHMDWIAEYLNFLKANNNEQSKKQQKVKRTRKKRYYGVSLFLILSDAEAKNEWGDFGLLHLLFEFVYVVVYTQYTEIECNIFKKEFLFYRQKK